MSLYSQSRDKERNIKLISEQKKTTPNIIIPVTKPDRSLSKSWKNSVTLILLVCARVLTELWKFSRAAEAAIVFAVPPKTKYKQDVFVNYQV